MPTQRAAPWLPLLAASLASSPFAARAGATRVGLTDGRLPGCASYAPRGGSWTNTLALPLNAVDGGLAIAPEAMATLSPKQERSFMRDDALEYGAVVEVDRLRKCNVVGLDEARARLALMRVQLDLDFRSRRIGDSLCGLHSLPPTSDALPSSVRAWRSALASRIEKLLHGAPLRGTPARRIGSVSTGLHFWFTDQPDFFWRGHQLCVRQELDQAAQMRCFDADQRKWTPVETYVSPYAPSTRAEVESGTHVNGFVDKAEVVWADGGRWEQEVDPGAHIIGRGQNGGAFFLKNGAAEGELELQAEPDSLTKGELAGTSVFDQGPLDGGFGTDAVVLSTATATGADLAESGRFVNIHRTCGRSLDDARLWPIEVPGLPEVGCDDLLASDDGRFVACLGATPSPDGADGGVLRRELAVFSLVRR